VKKSQGVKKAVTFNPACIASIGIAATLLIGFPRISFADGSEIDVLEKSAHISKVITERSENTGVPESSGLIEDSSNLNENLSTTEGEDNEALNFETSSVYPNDGQIYSRLDEGRIGSNYTGWNESGTAWYDNGVMARSHCFYDPGTGAWYWADADGSIAAGKDVFIPKDESDRSKGGKWVRFEADRTMVKGEDFRYGGWYLFDRVTGEMAKGFAVPDGKKWCYYDPVTGKMQYGERAIDGGWYYLTPGTGAVDYEWALIPKAGGGVKWVYYGPEGGSGRMRYGVQVIRGVRCYFNLHTGEVESTGGVSLNALTSTNMQRMVEVNFGYATNGGSASQADIWKYIDPSRFTPASSAYLQFADLRGNMGLTPSQINDFIDSSSAGRRGTLHNQGAAIAAAAKQYNLNEAYLIAHMILESGWGTSKLASGKQWDAHEFNGQKYPAGQYYNYIGWGAFDNNPYVGGMNYAQINGWSSPHNAIFGAAKVLSKNYIHNSAYGPQYTLYGMRWNHDYTLAHNVRSPHQYCTSITWPTSIAQLMKQCISSSGIDWNPYFLVPSY
jgi:beta-N-acetylglucosaminidase